METAGKSPKQLFSEGYYTKGCNDRTRSFNSEVHLPSPPTGKNCRWCWQPITEKRRRNWCGEGCLNEYQELRDVFDPAAMRARVFARDNGVCAICGVDTEMLKDRLWPKLPMAPVIDTGWTTGEQGLQIAAKARDAAAEWAQQILDFARTIAARGLVLNMYPWASKLKRSDAYWEADHVIPVVEHGGCTKIDNYRTACRSCHKSATKDLRGRLARKPKK